jgi:hypothetical protein
MSLPTSAKATIAASIETLIRHSHANGLEAYAVLDGAQAEGVHEKLYDYVIRNESLFDHTHEANLPEIAPRLIRWPQLDDDKLPRRCHVLAVLAAKNPCLSWFASAAPIGELAAHLRRFHLVDLSENQKLLMRWYDTRNLAAWVQCLTDTQRALFFSGTANWSFADRFGRVQTLSSPSQLSAIPAEVPTPYLKEPIQLDDAQLDTLMAAAEPQLIIDRLQDVIPDEVRALPYAVLFDFVRNAASLARRARLKDLNRQVPIALIGLYTSGQAYARPEFQDLLATAEQLASNKLSEQIASLPAAVWQSGPPLWDPQNKRTQIQADNWIDWLESDAPPRTPLPDSDGDPH